MARPILTLEERFMQYVSPEPNSGCWLWTGMVSEDGYGRFQIGSRTDGSRNQDGAHRISWRMVHGEIPAGLLVLHSCDVRSCVRADHLFLGTQLDNCLDMARKWRGKRSGSGLPFGVSKRSENCFAAEVYYSGKRAYLGCFRTAEEAGARALEVKLLCHSSEVNGRPDESEADRFPVDLRPGSHRVDSPDSLAGTEAAIPDPDRRAVADPVLSGDDSSG